MSQVRLDRAQRRELLRELAESEGYSNVAQMIDDAIMGRVSPAICTMPRCGYTGEYEPDQREGYCESCGEQSVQSALVLAELM